MSAIVMTYSLAMGAAQDLANRRMRSQGRERWNLEDRNLAAAEFWRLYGNEAIATRGFTR